MSLLRLPENPDLAGEADHRIGNSLAAIGGLVRVRARTIESCADPKAFLLEIADRIETVAVLHRMMAHSDADEIPLAEYLRAICDKLKRALGSAKTTLSVACAPARIVPFRVALPLGLMTGELFSNSLKYAHPTGLPTRVHIACEATKDGGMTFVFEDDGVGFPEDFDVSRPSSMGLRFIHSLASQLGATHTWSSDPLGIRFELRLDGKVLAAAKSATPRPHDATPDAHTARPQQEAQGQSSGSAL